MSDLTGANVEFRVVQKRRSTGRAREYIETHVGKVKKVIGNTVVIEGQEKGLGGGLHSRPIGEIVVLDVGK